MCSRKTYGFRSLRSHVGELHSLMVDVSATIADNGGESQRRKMGASRHQQQKQHPKRLEAIQFSIIVSPSLSNCRLYRNRDSHNSTPFGPPCKAAQSVCRSLSCDAIRVDLCLLTDRQHRHSLPSGTASRTFDPPSDGVTACAHDQLSSRDRLLPLSRFQTEK